MLKNDVHHSEQKWHFLMRNRVSKPRCSWVTKTAIKIRPNWIGVLYSGLTVESGAFGKLKKIIN